MEKDSPDYTFVPQIRDIIYPKGSNKDRRFLKDPNTKVYYRPMTGEKARACLFKVEGERGDATVVTPGGILFDPRLESEESRAKVLAMLHKTIVWPLLMRWSAI